MKRTWPLGRKIFDQRQTQPTIRPRAGRSEASVGNTRNMCDVSHLLLLLLLSVLLLANCASARDDFKSESEVSSTEELEPPYGSNLRYYGMSDDDYQDGSLSGPDWPEDSEMAALGSPKAKKWTGPEERSRARMLYNYLLSRRFGGDIFGKRMGSSYPMNKFRFFASDPSAGGGIHGSEFLGKRARISEFLGKRDSEDALENGEYLNGVSGKRARVSEFLGKRARVSEFLGKRARVSEFLGKRSAPSTMPQKRARVSEFLGKRDDGAIEMPQKKARVSEFLGKRVDPSEFYGKRARISEFLGKRLINPYDLSNKRTRVSEFLGKRSRVSEFLGKRSENTGQYAKASLNDTAGEGELLSTRRSEEKS